MVGASGRTPRLEALSYPSKMHLNPCHKEKRGACFSVPSARAAKWMAQQPRTHLSPSEKGNLRQIVRTVRKHEKKPAKSGIQRLTQNENGCVRLRQTVRRFVRNGPPVLAHELAARSAARFARKFAAKYEARSRNQARTPPNHPPNQKKTTAMRGIECAFTAALGQHVELRASKAGKQFASFPCVVDMGQDEDG